MFIAEPLVWVLIGLAGIGALWLLCAVLFIGLLLIELPKAEMGEHFGGDDDEGVRPR